MESLPRLLDDVWTNITLSDHHSCSRDMSRDSCYMHQSEMGKRDVIATVRVVVSLLSILGTFSIIVSAIAKKQVLSHKQTGQNWSVSMVTANNEVRGLDFSLIFTAMLHEVKEYHTITMIISEKVHPIFVLSIADGMLAVLWVVGGALWLKGGVSEKRVGCFAVSLMTVILECVAVNLTLVYALLAYSGIKKKDFSNVYLLFERSKLEPPWSPYRTVLAYILAWVVPMVLIMIPFGVIAGDHHIVRDANKCSCWCIPYFGNVVPIAYPRDKATSRYVYHMRMFIASYGVVVGTNYLVVFVLLVIIYYKILKRIKRMRNLHIQNRSTHHLYGAAEGLIIQRQSKAKTRVIYFLTVFTISGFFNVLLSYAFTIYEIVKLNDGEAVQSTSPQITTSSFLLYVFQSITVPLQGFLNAIVYGWTREDFLYVMAGGVITEAEQLNNETAQVEVEDSGILSSIENSERSLTSSTR